MEDYWRYGRRLDQLRFVAQRSVQPTVGTRHVFELFLTSSFVRFDGESTLSPTAANAQPLSDIHRGSNVNSKE